jgi:hypothetical protein
MAPSATDTLSQTLPIQTSKAATTKPWLKRTGALDQYEHFEVTPVIGREYPHLDIVSLLQAENSDALLKELALTSKLIHLFNPKIDRLAGD